MIQEGDDSKMSAMMDQPAAPEKHEKSAGAGGSIVSILEVVESDFATNLAKEESMESDSAENYQSATQENRITKVAKTQDVKHKTKEIASLEKEMAELSSDREGTNSELAAVIEYYARVKQRCVAKPMSYEERQARRKDEIAGLKEALTILQNEAAFFQRSRAGHRGNKANFMGPDSEAA